MHLLYRMGCRLLLYFQRHLPKARRRLRRSFRYLRSRFRPSIGSRNILYGPRVRYPTWRKALKTPRHSPWAYRIRCRRNRQPYLRILRIFPRFRRQRREFLNIRLFLSALRFHMQARRAEDRCRREESISFLLGEFEARITVIFIVFFDFLIQFFTNFLKKSTILFFFSEGFCSVAGATGAILLCVSMPFFWGWP